MKRLVARYGLDLVEFPNWEGHGVWFSLWRSVPVVVRLHTSSLENLQITGDKRTRCDVWDIRREKRLAKTADALVTHSEAHCRRMAQELGVERDSIAVVPHGIPVHPGFIRSPSDKRYLTVVCLGRMEKRKGTVDFLQAIPVVVRECPQVRFVFIGADLPHCSGGRSHAQFIDNELPPESRARISLLGTRPDAEVDQWLQTADLFVGPSRYESFGLGFLEAMRWGTPVIGTTAGGIPEVVEHGKSGLLVAPENPCQLAEAMLSVLRNEDLRDRLGRQGRQRVESVFSSRRMGEGVSNLYADTLSDWHMKHRRQRWTRGSPEARDAVTGVTYLGPSRP
jgi:glycosyltransferase involved in cell wall biosynthesis